MAREIAFVRGVAADVAAKGGATFGATAARLGAAADALERATDYLLKTLAADPNAALAGAHAYLKLFGVALGGACLAKAGLAEGGDPGRIALARFFAEKLSPIAPGLADSVCSGADALAEAALKEVA